MQQLEENLTQSNLNRSVESDCNDYVFWISNNVPSSKNNKVWTGEFLVNSEAVQKWRRKAKYEIHAQAIWFQYMLSTLTRPYFIEFTFVRGTKHRFDYINALQVVLDDIVGYGKVPKRKKDKDGNLEPETEAELRRKPVYLGWLTNDDSTNIKPYFGNPIYDKENPGVIIKILKEEPIHDLQNITQPDYRLLKQQLNQSIILGRTFKQRNPEFSGEKGTSTKTRRRANS